MAGKCFLCLFDQSSSVILCFLRNIKLIQLDYSSYFFSRFSNSVLVLHIFTLRNEYVCLHGVFESYNFVIRITGRSLGFICEFSEHGDFPDLILCVSDSWSDRTPLHEAAYQGRLLHLRSLIAQGFHVDTLTMDRVSPLHEACLGGHYACAKFLLDNGANVRNMDSPLHAAVGCEGANIVDLLLDFGADGCCRNAEGKTPLDLSTPNSPCSLSQLCRFCIRRSLGRSRLHRTSSLFLPHSVQDFLLYQ
uniref:Ankyrin repeat and SOCS box protein 11 n=1 Tax=Seriola lalandi dorsalis TaxID=1841481 RepID=A0A3B4Y240_SERLL